MYGYKSKNKMDWKETTWGIIITVFFMFTFQDAGIALCAWFLWQFFSSTTVPGIFIVFLLVTSIRYMAIWVRQLILGK